MCILDAPLLGEELRFNTAELPSGLRDLLGLSSLLLAHPLLSDPWNSIKNASKPMNMTSKTMKHR